MTKIEQFIDQYPSVEGHDVTCVLEAMGLRLGQSAESLLSAALTDRFAAFHIVAAARRRHSQQNRG
jgi:hypothetical protein